MAILINPFRFAAAGDPPHWQELGRTTLSGTADDITVSSLANKPYIMVLGHIIPSGVLNNIMRLGYGSVDTGSNYAGRYSENGGTDGTDTSATYMVDDRSAEANDQFWVSNISNIANQEKLEITDICKRGTAGVGNAPERVENVGKWTNTSNVLDTFSLHNSGAGDMASGSEVVVLGYDPADTTGTNAWEELGTTTLSSSSDTLDVSFTAKKYLMIKWSTAPTGSDANPNGRCGIGSIDTGSNYAKRENSNGGTDSTGTTSSDLPTSIVGAGKHYGTIFCVNTSGQEKLMIGESVRDGGTGAGSAPERKEWVAKYTVTSGQINRWQIFNGSDTGGNDLAIGSTISVWGFD